MLENTIEIVSANAEDMLMLSFMLKRKKEKSVFFALKYSFMIGFTILLAPSANI